jgi:hypothetical protein
MIRHETITTVQDCKLYAVTTDNVFAWIVMLDRDGDELRLSMKPAAAIALAHAIMARWENNNGRH